VTEPDRSDGVSKIQTGIPGFDRISKGGLPGGRTTLLSGTAGSGKTIFASQFLAEGIDAFDEHGVFITFEESPDDIRTNLESFGWPIGAWEADQRWTFIDVSPDVTQELVTGKFDLSALIARIENAIERTGARRVVIDSLSALYNLFVEPDRVRQELYRIISRINNLGATTLLTAEREQEYGPIARYGVEEFVADNVMILRNVLNEGVRRRTIEILKYRGCDHLKGEYPFTIVAGQGIEVLSLTDLNVHTGRMAERVTTGVTELDEMSKGGYFKNSIILVSGATGTGKTLTSNHFLAQGAENGQRCMLFGYEESEGQMIRNAKGWGMDFDEMREEGFLHLQYEFPESSNLEDRLVKMKQQVREFQPERVVLDSLTALKRYVSVSSFREFVLELSSFLKQEQITTIMTLSIPAMSAMDKLTDAHLSSLVDTIVMLRYVEQFGTIQRGIIILKMRGTDHEQFIRRFSIDETGMQVHDPFTNVSGVLSGSLSHRMGDDIEQKSQEARNRDRD